MAVRSKQLHAAIALPIHEQSSVLGPQLRRQFLHSVGSNGGILLENLSSGHGAKSEPEAGQEENIDS